MEMEYKSYNGFQIVQELVKLRWVPEILKTIENENKRYSEILSCIPYLSHTELNRKLTILMQKNAIEKKTHEGIINYSLLDFGKDLVHIFNHLEDLEEKYCVRS